MKIERYIMWVGVVMNGDKWEQIMDMVSLCGDVGCSGKLMMECDGSVGNMGVQGEW